ncbi:MAG: nucleotidyl transferase AbiEii/AbiGii toxin family protein [Brevinematia bacterium]
MHLKNLIKKIAGVLEKNKIGYIIVGGQAVIVYGIFRTTKDIDITIDIDINEIEKVIQILRKIGLKVLVSEPENFVRDVFVLPAIEEKSKIRVDIIFGLSPFEKEAIKRANKIKIDNVNVRFISIEDLIIQKVISKRNKDTEDVKILLTKNKNINENYVIDWLKKLEEVMEENLVEKFLSLKN